MFEGQSVSITIELNTQDKILELGQSLSEIREVQVFLESIHRLLDASRVSGETDLEEILSEVNTLLSAVDITHAKATLKEAIDLLSRLNTLIRLNTNMNLLA
jgi:hypothetical protein